MSVKLRSEECLGNWDTNEREEFRSLALRYCEIAEKAGIKIVPFVSPEMPFYHKASPETRKQALQCFKTIVDIHEETLAAGENTLNTTRLVWRALSKFSLIPSPDIFSRLTNENVVVIYGLEQTALFWNMQFFKYASFTVEHMFFCHWYEFTHREPAVQERFHEILKDVYTGKISGTFNPSVPPHCVEELNTSECIKTWFEMPLISTLSKDGKFAAMLTVKKMKIIGSKTVNQLAT